MDFRNSSDGFSFPSFVLPPSPLDLSKYKYLLEEEDRRRQRNQDILAKIQDLKLSSTLQASRSEILRQMQAEQRALVEKYFGERKLPKASSYDGGLTSNEDKNLARTFVSTGINTDLTGPVRLIQPSSNLQNEKYVPSSVPDPIRFPEKNLNQATQAQMTEVKALPFTQRNYQKEDGVSAPVTTTARRLAFLDLSTSDDSEMTTTGAEAINLRRNGSRRFSVSGAAGAMFKFLADETSDATTTSVSVFPRNSEIRSRKLSFPINNSHLSSKDMNVSRGGGNDGVENANLTHGESPTTSFGESLLDSLHQKTLPQVTDMESKEAESEEERRRGNGEDVGSNQSVGISSSGTAESSIQKLVEKDPKVTDEKGTDGNGGKEIGFPGTTPENETGPSSDTDDLSYSDPNPPNEESGFNNRPPGNEEINRAEKHQIKSDPEEKETRNDGVSNIQRSGPLKLKLAYDDSESEISEKEKEPFKLEKKGTDVLKVGGDDTVKKAGIAEDEDDDDADSFFDL